MPGCPTYASSCCKAVSENVISVRDLRKRFGEVIALDGVSFDVPPTTIFGLLGPNGAGKTTAARILSTVLRADGGTATVLGRDVMREPGAVRRRIGLAGQSAAVDPNLTGRENLRMVGLLRQLARRDVARQTDELLERFDLVQAADRPLRTYSGGMRRRLDVAASLLGAPPILFLDEPTTGLDLTSRNQLWETIRELVRGGTTVLLTTQYLEEADRLADRVAVVDNGQVIANDTPARLKAQLGGTVIEMGFGDGDAERAVSLLEGRVNVAVERSEEGLKVTSHRGAYLLVEILRVLGDHSLDPVSLSVREPSLDDVFLALTGHAARAGAEDAAETSAATSARRGS